ncbi:MAG: bifunctional phosphopantothenoylcysteine decarboxylase/phosphopantothenate--cysteine ligase CoaBC [Bacteroidetes bacterium]|nr:bifunctional phosphopantothenoylcysteine decarboxylase/phosphopantothenate--cysteine ligase CoaBC [Bacteroidota bacterium]MCL1967950.1 bifunctional phosphopantothenoylcysteine decarboxylase/phosphopantothenate--cysteine ligase CoaBC [Bacteroidota bacterium]
MTPKSAPKKIILGITGGIAAYKSLSLIRLFKKSGHEVKVVITKNGLQFVTPLTLETLSQNAIHSDCFTRNEPFSVEHISYAEWADVVVIAPASANIIGKFANGIADDALSTLLLAVKKPIFLAPAMNVNMYENEAVQRNLAQLEKQGCHIIEPTEGDLACGISAKGRMEEPEKIFEIITQFFAEKKKWLGKRAVVTAGPTYEPIDPVRFIGNHSSGLMGFALAEKLAAQGAEVTLITGPTALHTTNKKIQRIDVVTAKEMLDQTLAYSKNADIIIMAAAVADYTPKTVASEKIKKKNNDWELPLQKTTDILLELGKRKEKKQCLAGFALETENETENAKQKLQQKNADFIVLNSLKNKGAGFKCNTNQVTVFAKNGAVFEGKCKDKTEVAAEILEFVFKEFFE